MDKANIMYFLDPQVPIKTEIHLLENAVLVPSPIRRNWSIEAGIFDQNGAIFEPAICWHSQRQMATRPPEKMPPEDTIQNVLGTFVFGGLYLDHFVHFLCESTSRLWAAEYIGEKIDKLLFFSLKGGRGDPVKKRFQEWSFFNPQNWTPEIIRKPLRVEKLYVPKQGFGPQKLLGAAPEYRNFTRSCLNKNWTDTGHQRLYISRSKINPQKGGIVGEERLEELLQKQGYHIFHPQDHSLDSQLAHYASANQIIGGDGSPFHLIAMSPNPEKTICVIQRRPTVDYLHIVGHLQAFGITNAFTVVGTGRGWSPGNLSRAGRSLNGVISLRTVSQCLAKV